MSAIVSSVESGPVSHAAAAGQTDFDVTFPFYDSRELIVTIDGAAATNFFAVGAGVKSGDGLRYITLPPQDAGAIVVIDRAVQPVRSTDFSSGGTLDVALLDKELDRLFMSRQDADVDLSRSIRVPGGEDALSVEPAAQRAGKLWKWGPDGKPSSFNPELSLSVIDGRDIWVATADAVDLMAFGDEIMGIYCTGYYEPYDGGGHFLRRWHGAGDAPGVRASADGKLWIVAEDKPNPRMFGGRIDAVTDDMPAHKMLVAYCRTNKVVGYLCAGEAYLVGTFFHGGAVIVGMGGVDNTKHNYVSQSVLACTGNPLASHAVSETQGVSFGLTALMKCVLRPAGADTPVDIYDQDGYAGRLGYNAGRYVGDPLTLPGDDGSGAGGGRLILHEVTLQDCSGWGLYAYMLWGRSVLSNIFIRRCGGELAHILDDDTRSGGMCFHGPCVDFTVIDPHDYNGGYADPAMNGRGTGIKIGCERDDLAGRRLYGIGGNQLFRGVFVERRRMTIDVADTLSAMFLQTSVSDGEMRLGRGSHPDNNCKVSFRQSRSFQLTKITIEGQLVDLGDFLNQDGATELVIEYYTGFKMDRPDSAAAGSRMKVRFEPKMDASAIKGTKSLANFRPLANMATPTVSALSNCAMPFGVEGSNAIAHWVHNGVGGAQANQPGELRMLNGARLTLDMAGFFPGDLMTMQFLVVVKNPNALSNFTYGVEDENGIAIFDRPLSSLDIKAEDFPSPQDALHFWRGFNFRVPDGVLFRLFFSQAGGNAIYVRTPMLTPDLMAPMRDERMRLWPTPAGMIPVTW